MSFLLVLVLPALSGVEGLALVLTGQEELKPGLVGEYIYVGKPLEDFVRPDKEVGPRFKRVDKQVDFLRNEDRFAGTKLKDFFVVRWTGLVRIPKDGGADWQPLASARLMDAPRVAVVSGTCPPRQVT